MRPHARTLAAVTALIFGCAAAQSDQLAALGTDTRFATVPLDALESGGPPPNGIPPLGFRGDRRGQPDTRPARFETVEQAGRWLKPREPVILASAGGETGVFPLQVLVWHEIANVEFGGVPVAVTFCPLCNTAVVVDRRIPVSAEAARRPNAPAGPTVLATFGVSGLLYHSDLVMFDSATRTLWSQAIAEGIVGTLAGTKLKVLPSQIVAFETAAKAAPRARVLSRDTGYERDYGRNPYVGYDDLDSPPFLFRGPADGRLPPKERVVTVSLGAADVAYPFSLLAERRVVNDAVGGMPVAVLWAPGTTSALDAASIAGSRDVGAAGVFDRRVGGRTLTLERAGEAFRDRETGSTWSVTGEATAGPLAGRRLASVAHANHFWFAWAAFKPGTRIFR